MSSSFVRPAEIRFCPRCAHRLETRLLEDRERLVCPSCGYIFYLNPKVAAGALVEADGKVLLVRRGVEPGRGAWGLPAGFAELDETIEETALREVREESGLVVELDELLGVYSFEWPGRGVLILYSAHPVGGELAPGYDAEEARFFAPQELPLPIAFRTHAQALDEWRRVRGLTYRSSAPGERERAVELGRAHGFHRPQLLEATSVLVASDGEELVGFASLFLEAEGAELRHLFVHPRYRRWGVGTRLIDEAARQARELGAAELLTRLPATSEALIVFLRTGFTLREVGADRAVLALPLGGA